MFLFHPKQEIVTRSFDIAGHGFAHVETRPKQALGIEDRQFVWTINHIKNFAALFSSIFLSAMAYGILTVMIAFKLEHNVVDEVLISISSVVQIGAGVLFSRFLPDVGRKVGMINSLYLGSGISAICALFLFFYPGYLLWLVLIYLIGTSFFICGVTRNTIMIDIAPRHVKGFIISCGGMLVAFGNSMGPVIINVFNISEGLLPLMIACALFFFSMVPLSRLKNVVTDIKQEKTVSLSRYIKNSPKIMLAGFAVGYSISSINAFLIIYGIKIGMTKMEASLLLSAFLFGTAFSIPLGYLTDLINKRLVMISSAALSLACILMNSHSNADHNIQIFLFVLFGLLSGIKLPALILINEKYKPTQRLAVNSAFSRFSLLGNITGLFCTGLFIKAFGPQGLWFSVMSILTIFLCFCLSNYAFRLWRGKITLKQFSFLNDPNQDEQQIEI